MSGLDELLTSQAEGRGIGVVLALAFLLGLRHAADPDHLVAVSTLVASAAQRRTRLAARLGAAWGTGHAVTLLAFGLPVVLVNAYVPELLRRAAEVLIGAIIALLAVRLLRAWRRGAFHAHVHEHDGRRHAHLHGHAHAVDHEHEHELRSPRQAFAIGTVHGFAGSGAVTVLLLAAIPGRALAAAALVVLAVGTALSMTLLSSGFGSLLGAERARRSLGVAVPVLGVVAAGFGTWYALAALLGEA